MSLLPDTIFKEFKDWLLRSSDLNWKTPNSEWTKCILPFFSELGEKKGFISHYSPKAGGDKEYLVDLVWKINSPKRWLQMALESEISSPTPKGILEDFEKLVDIKAYLKVGIFKIDAKKEDEVLEEMLELLNKQMIVGPKEDYLIVFMRRDKNDENLCLSCYHLPVANLIPRELHKEKYQLN